MRLNIKKDFKIDYIKNKKVAGILKFVNNKWELKIKTKKF